MEAHQLWSLTQVYTDQVIKIPRLASSCDKLFTASLLICEIKLTASYADLKETLFWFNFTCCENSFYA